MRRALALTLVLVAAGCGGDGEGDVQPDAWVRTVCTTLTDWNGQLQSRTRDLRTELRGLGQECPPWMVAVMSPS